jgi:hypothetical protein
MPVNTHLMPKDSPKIFQVVDKPPAQMDKRGEVNEAGIEFLSI